MSMVGGRPGDIAGNPGISIRPYNGTNCTQLVQFVVVVLFDVLVSVFILGVQGLAATTSFFSKCDLRMELETLAAGQAAYDCCGLP